MHYYTYLWLREDSTPYYIGKGQGDRAFKRQERHLTPPTDIQRLILLHFDTEEEAFAKEVELIAQFGRKDLGTGCLRNLTAGGDGVRHLNPDSRERIRRASRKPKSDSMRRKCAKRMRGVRLHCTPHTEATKEKIRNTLKRQLTPAALEHLKQIARLGALRRWSK